MSQKNIHREFFHFVLPSMLAFALSGVYAIADGFFVGNALGDHALAAGNIAYPMCAFLQAVGTGIGMGGAIKYSLSVGTGELEKSRRYFGIAIVILSVLGAALTGILWAAATPILLLFGASGEILALAEEYLHFIALGAVFQVMGTGLVPFIRNMGGSVIAMAAMIAGFLTNIVLDYAFVWVLPWGMMGAAVATAAGQAVTCLMCVSFFVIKKQEPDFCFGSGAAHLAGQVFKVALSPFGLTFSPNITLMLINKSAMVFGGADAVTCYAPLSYISAVVMLLIQGVSDGSQPLLSLSYGEGRIERTRAFRSMARRFAAAVALACMAVLFAARAQAALLFGASPHIAEEVGEILPIFISGFLFVSVSRVTTAYFYATGKNALSYILIYGEPAFMALCLLIVPGIAGLAGTWACVPAAQVFAAALSMAFIRAEGEKNRKARLS